jgi:hypothetical protein
VQRNRTHIYTLSPYQPHTNRMKINPLSHIDKRWNISNSSLLHITMPYQIKSFESVILCVSPCVYFLSFQASDYAALIGPTLAKSSRFILIFPSIVFFKLIWIPLLGIIFPMLRTMAEYHCLAGTLRNEHMLGSSQTA